MRVLELMRVTETLVSDLAQSDSQALAECCPIFPLSAKDWSVFSRPIFKVPGTLDAKRCKMCKRGSTSEPATLNGVYKRDTTRKVLCILCVG